MAASSRSTRTFAGTRQLAAALVATLALALVLVAGIGTVVMSNHIAPVNGNPIVSSHDIGGSNRLQLPR